MTREEILAAAKPILFNTDMVRAILEGRKTATRRICKDGNEYTTPDMSFFDASSRTYAVHNYADTGHTDKLSIAERKCPICPGDTLYVRETWSEWTDGYIYRAWTSPFSQPGEYLIIKWKPSIHMPKEAARIFLKVIEIRVERLQDMCSIDCLKEGIESEYPHLLNGEEKRYAFSQLWNSTIKKSDLDQYGWNANPWVWVIEFERCENPAE